ncbi:MULTISPECIES: hypothetical protein [Streptomyces]|uniref:Uncharacterized protein n=1 Tax=Streptomyces pakalii TaxID=3036494 RepID=A0ABT7DED5_9ACTN|nr:MULTISPECIES: hypothetical protein [Streptomyces]MDJ1644189.1 hypothetical protein [Streptomyces pakalii]
MLATAFVGALALGALSAQGAGDITWDSQEAASAPAAQAAVPGDITWGAAPARTVA